MFKVKGAVIEGVKQDANGVKALAKMPGLPELRAKLLGLFNQPATKLARTIKEPGGALARVINAKATKAA
jgi:large subunit ribosomal protein L10